MVKNLSAMQKAQVRSLGQEDFPGEGNGNPLQYSCLENGEYSCLSEGQGAWWATVRGGHKELETTERLTLSLS